MMITFPKETHFAKLYNLAYLWVIFIVTSRLNTLLEMLENLQNFYVTKVT